MYRSDGSYDNDPALQLACDVYIHLANFRRLGGIECIISNYKGPLVLLHLSYMTFVCSIKPKFGGVRATPGPLEYM